MRISWTDEAKEQLETIYSMYKEVSLNVAMNIRRNIVLSTRSLREFSLMAQKEPLLQKRKIEYRSLVVEKHFKVVYSIENGIIYIAGVWDCRRDPKTNQKQIKK